MALSILDQILEALRELAEDAFPPPEPPPKPLPAWLDKPWPPRKFVQGLPCDYCGRIGPVAFCTMQQLPRSTAGEKRQLCRDCLEIEEFHLEPPPPMEQQSKPPRSWKRLANIIKAG